MRRKNFLYFTHCSSGLTNNTACNSSMFAWFVFCLFHGSDMAEPAGFRQVRCDVCCQTPGKADHREVIKGCFQPPGVDSLKQCVLASIASPV